MPTVDLFPGESPDAEDFFTSWLQPMLRASTEHKQTDSYPFAVVQYISGADDPETGVEDGVVQVDFFDKARDGMVAAQAAKITARDGHRRIMYLAHHIADVTMADGSTANCDYINTVMKPVRMDFADEKVVRYVARYQVGLSYVSHIEFDNS